jgi:cytosine/adenosine deaminase-related metal-dependent hydrolase
MIFEADWVLPIAAAPIEKGAVRVEDGTITEVGPASDLARRFPDEERTRFHHAILMPGFVNAHVHLEYSVFRGLYDDCNFGDWMLRFMVGKRRLDKEMYLASARLGAMECVGSGITSIGDTVADGDATVTAANEFGLRAYAFLEAFGMDDSLIDQTLRVLDERIERLRRLAGPRVSVGLSPHAPYTVSGPLYRALTSFALDRGLKVMTHVAESPAEVTFVRNGSGVLAHDFREAAGWEHLMWMPTGTSVVKYLEQWEALESDLVAVHAVQVSPADIEVLKKHDVAVAHCPKSNAKLGCGVAPIDDFLKAGLRVGIGTDSLASNNILDMFDEMRMTIFLQRAMRGNTTCMGAPEVLRLATTGGARVLGIDHLVGTLEPGKRADMICVDMEYSHFAPIDDPTSALVYGANQEDVFFTMIDGQVVYDKKVFKGVDAEGITRQASAVRARLRG